MPPTLIVVSGPAGVGKTTLAHQVASALGCPAVCRDEIKEGMVLSTPGFTPSPGDHLTVRTLSTFFDVLRLLLDAGVTLVAEAAFQDHVWRPRLLPLTDTASLRIIRCRVDASVARARVIRRAEEQATRAAHDDRGWLEAQASSAQPYGAFVPIAMAAPTLNVDTTDGYDPGMPAILEFIRTGGGSELGRSAAPEPT